jgi:hypothetical protein
MLQKNYSFSNTASIKNSHQLANLLFMNMCGGSLFSPHQIEIECSMRSNTTKAQRKANTIKQLCTANAAANGYTLERKNSAIMIFILCV